MGVRKVRAAVVHGLQVRAHINDQACDLVLGAPDVTHALHEAAQYIFADLDVAESPAQR